MAEAWGEAGLLGVSRLKPAALLPAILLLRRQACATCSASRAVLRQESPRAFQHYRKHPEDRGQGDKEL